MLLQGPPFGRPAIDRVVLQFAAGGESGLVELLAGKVDELPTTSLLEVSRLAADPRFHVYYVPTPQSAWLTWNHRHPVLGDARLRRALTLALDRPSLARGLGLPERLPVTDGPFTACQRERGDIASPWPHDPALAERLLDLFQEGDFEAMIPRLVPRSRRSTARRSPPPSCTYAWRRSWGRMVEEGPAERVIAEPLHPYTAALVSAVPDATGGRPRDPAREVGTRAWPGRSADEILGR